MTLRNEVIEYAYRRIFHGLVRELKLVRECKDSRLAIRALVEEVFSEKGLDLQDCYSELEYPDRSKDHIPVGELERRGLTLVSRLMAESLMKTSFYKVKKDTAYSYRSPRVRFECVGITNLPSTEGLAH